MREMITCPRSEAQLAVTYLEAMLGVVVDSSCPVILMVHYTGLKCSYKIGRPIIRGRNAQQSFKVDHEEDRR